MKKAVVILPTYNEKNNIQTLIPAIFAVAASLTQWQLSILIVDDQSPDQTAELVKKLQKNYPSLYLIQGEKKGLGNAYLRGFRYGLEKLKADVIFEMDADWSHDPALIPQFLKKIDAGADFVIGSRYIKGGAIPGDWRLDRKLFSILGNLIVKYGLMVLKINDWTSGYRAMKTGFLKTMLHNLHQYSGYVFQVALLNRVYQKGLCVAEIPLRFQDRQKGESKIHSAQYIINTLLYVLTHSSFIKFVIVGVIGFLIDFLISFALIEKVKLAIWFSTIISAETAIVSNFLLNNFWSFSYKKIKHKMNSYFAKFVHFNFVSLGSILIQTVGLTLATILFPHYWWFIYKIIIIVFLIIPYSYCMYNFVIWKKK